MTCCVSCIIGDACWAVVEPAISFMVTGGIKAIIMVTGGSRTIITGIIRYHGNKKLQQEIQNE